ncbi:amino acid ABC transporter permease [Pseudomonas syringae]|uniref:Permease component n=1 Tax=Pseudomonas syringae pv. actinidiae TaxID=103796 RepID=A0A2V0QJN4_PSESF|nr:amino acid ABC transporter permease [Pseudomonas syringae]BBI43222.1 inner membrane amino-acid ABC transporter permease protein YhdY [Pseudomonas syringae pv. actinidiae]GBH08800.1 permease component [Pseudomonas syringae pv. actinidiae]
MKSSHSWARRTLFRNPSDAGITVITTLVCGWAALSLATWAINAAQWDIIVDNLKVLLVGIYPAEALWRVWMFLSAMMIAASFAGGRLFGFNVRSGAILGGLLLALSAIAIYVGVSGSQWLLIASLVSTTFYYLGASDVRWVRAGANLIVLFIAIAGTYVLLSHQVKGIGGLLLSTLITLVTSLMVIPLGVLLALGRQSKILSLRVCCTAFIETIRSMPLILVVYGVWISVPLVFQGSDIPDVYRGMLGFVIFYSAYSAEFVRSGLLSIPRGQTEAAASLGLSKFHTQTEIILPQALRVSIPSLVGNILDVFNFAPLIFIIGLTEFMRAGQIVLSNPQYSAHAYEVFVFLFAVYFVIGSCLTFFSRRLEAIYAKGSR